MNIPSKIAYTILATATLWMITFMPEKCKGPDGHILAW